MRYAIDTASDAPPSRQLVEAVLDAVASGALAPGERLPSVRALAAEALVNPNTVAKAYRDLEHLRVASAQNGLGVFVAPGAPAIARSARRRATLIAYRRAAREALRAGHDEARLTKTLDRIARAAEAAPEETT